MTSATPADAIYRQRKGPRQAPWPRLITVTVPARPSATYASPVHGSTVSPSGPLPSGITAVTAAAFSPMADSAQPEAVPAPEATAHTTPAAGSAATGPAPLPTGIIAVSFPVTSLTAVTDPDAALASNNSRARGSAASQNGR
jgi:hypothetical protein